MKLQQLLSFTRKAVDTYQMIQPGDKIAIGISGGKDSLTLLYALHGLKRFYPNPFEIEAITVDLGFDGFETCLLYTSDAADDMQCVDLGGRRIIKKKFFQAEDGIRDFCLSRGLGDVYKRQQQYVPSLQALQNLWNSHSCS